MINLTYKLGETMACVKAGANSASDVSENLGISQDNARSRLKILTRKGLLIRPKGIAGHKVKIRYKLTGIDYDADTTPPIITPAKIDGQFRDARTVGYKAMDFFNFRAVV